MTMDSAQAWALLLGSAVTAFGTIWNLVRVNKVKAAADDASEKASTAAVQSVANGAKADQIHSLVNGNYSKMSAQVDALTQRLDQVYDRMDQVQEKRVADVKAAASQTASDVKDAIQSVAANVQAAIPDPNTPSKVIVVGNSDRRNDERRKDTP